MLRLQMDSGAVRKVSTVKFCCNTVLLIHTKKCIRDFKNAKFFPGLLVLCV